MTGYAVQELQKGHINKIIYVPNNSYNENSMELGALPGQIKSAPLYCEIY